MNAILCIIIKIFNSFIGLIIKIYNTIFNLLCALDSDIRKDVFIGVTGLMVAIIIFIAEVISNKKYEIEKNTILNETGIVKNMGFCIIIYLVMFLSSVITTSNGNPVNSFFENNITYFILQSFLNVSIVFFIIKTFNIFKMAVKLNTDQKYFNEEIDKYINKKTAIVEQKIKKNIVKSSKKNCQDFENYINRNKFFLIMSEDFKFDENQYTSIFPYKDGFLKCYDYKKLNSIVEMIKEKRFSNGIIEYANLEEPILIFNAEPGDKILENNAIVYCKKEYDLYFKNIVSYVIYDTDSIYMDAEIDSIVKDLFNMAKIFNEPFDFDENNRLFNFCEYIYENDLTVTKQILLRYFDNTMKELYKSEYKNKHYAIFLNRILMLSYKYKKYDDFRFINNLICDLYISQLLNKNYDSQKVAYCFANFYFRVDYVSVKIEKDKRYYDEVMSSLFKILFNLIKKKQFKAITTLFKNIILDSQNIVDDDLDDTGIINLQFACGMIHSIMLLTDKNKITEEEKREIIKIIYWLFNHFINIYDAWTFISNFKLYYNKTTSIENAYSRLELNFANHELVNSIIVSKTNERLILKECLMAFDLDCIFPDNKDFSKITKDDVSYYKDLLKMFVDNIQTPFEEMLKKGFAKKDIIETLNEAINEASKKEDEYNRNHKLSTKKIRSFEIAIKAEINKNTELTDYLKKYGKLEETDIKLKKMLTTGQLIPRKWFFGSATTIEHVAKDIGKAFYRSIEQEYLQKINNFSKEVNINEAISKIKNTNEYVLIMDYAHCYKIKSYDKTTNSVLIDNKKIEVIQISKAEQIYLIKKKYLPKIQYCSFSDSVAKNNIDKHIYYQFIDCAKNEKIRNKLIKNIDWLSEKGNIDEQQNYLKTQCYLKICLSCKFVKVKNSTAITLILNHDWKN